jgi:hypothetical protein
VILTEWKVLDEFPELVLTPTITFTELKEKTNAMALVFKEFPFYGSGTKVPKAFIQDRVQFIKLHCYFFQKEIATTNNDITINECDIENYIESITETHSSSKTKLELCLSNSKIRTLLNEEENLSNKNLLKYKEFLFQLDENSIVNKIIKRFRK